MNTITLNSQTISYNNIYYISSTGNDSTGDGSKNNPFSTYDKVFSKSSDGDLIYFIKGNYIISTLYTVDAYSAAFLYDNNKQLIIYAEPYTYININNPNNSVRDSHAIVINNSNTKVIGFTIYYNITNRSSSYDGSLFACGINYSSSGYIYNCHFILNSTTSFSYANNGCTLKCINCQFDIKNSVYYSYTGVISFQNCSFNIIKNTFNNIVTYTDLGNNIFNITYDSNYKIIPSTTCGVMYGLYKWLNYKFLIQDEYIKTISNNLLSTTGETNPNSNLFNQYGMDDLSNINSNIISMITNKKFKIILKKS